MNPAPTAPATTKPLARPHNCYNVFFILEREKLIRETREQAAASTPSPSPCKSERGASSSSCDLSGYYFLDLPELPPRYRGLELSQDWYVPGRKAGRKHVKNEETHGREYELISYAHSFSTRLTSNRSTFKSLCPPVTSFADLARTVSTNWKVADADTKDYCRAVARILKNRHSALTQDRSTPLPIAGSNVQASEDKSRQQSAVSKKWKGVQTSIQNTQQGQNQSKSRQMLRQLMQQQQSKRQSTMSNLCTSNALAFDPWELLARFSSVGCGASLNVRVPYGDVTSTGQLFLDSEYCCPVTPEECGSVVRTN